MQKYGEYLLKQSDKNLKTANVFQQFLVVSLFPWIKKIMETYNGLG